MKLRSIEITSFGKFRNKKIDFSDGLNIVCGNNESGKSTIISFIYAMLYGFGDNRGKGLSSREKYLPWDGGECEGKLNLTSDEGQNITIYRKSGSAKKYDVLKIYDTDTAENLSFTAEEIAGVSSETFLKTVCIRQLSSVFDGENSEIVTRLANIAQSGDESTSFKKAMKILEAARKEIRPLKGNGGSLASVNTEISALERAKANQEEAEQMLLRCKNMLENTTSAAEKAQIEYEEALKENYDVLIDNLKGRVAEKIDFIKSNPTKPALKKMYLYGVFAFTAFTVVTLIFKASLWFIPFILLLVCGALCAFDKKPAGTHPEEEKLQDLLLELSEFEKKKLQHQNKLANAKEAASSARQSLENLKMRITTLESQIEIVDTTPLAALYKKREKLTKEHSILSLVCDALESSHSNMQHSFTPAINKLASEYFSFLTDGKYERLFCDENFNLSIDADIPRESSFFSGGTVDQLYLSLRLALIDMLYKENSTFLILDQPFIQYDKSRTQKAVELLSGLPQNRQVILFSSEKIDFSLNIKTELLT